MASETPDEEAELMLMMEEFQKQEELKKQLEKDKDREQAMYGGSMRSKYGSGTPESSKMESILKNRERSTDQQKMAKEIKLQNQIKIPERLSRMEKDYPDAMKKKYNFHT